MRVLVVGLATTGDAVVRFALGRGDDVTVLEDAPGGDGYAERRTAAASSGAVVLERPEAAAAEAAARAADLVVPSPGVPERHPAVAAARAAGVPVRSEVDLAAEVAAVAGGPELVAVTGTNGKTTVSTLTTRILQAAGIRAEAAGNIGRPLLDAVHDAVDVVVAEMSSFQLAFTSVLRPRAAALLNLADDHLDWHRTFDAYARAKAHVFARQEGDDVLVFNADDPVVAGLAAEARGRRVPFSVAAGAAAGYRVVDSARGRVLVTADDVVLIGVDELPRRAPHDLSNALASAALAIAMGADPGAAADELRAFRGLPHRLQLVAERDGVRWYDDSKATNVHAALAAARGFDRVVLLAGGRNKGLPLEPLASLAPRLRGVVAIGESAGEVAHAFATVGGSIPVRSAPTMRDAVRAAAAMARAGDAVLLSPACASFDWYDSYAARGDDFAAEVRALPGPAGAGRDERADGAS